MLRTYFYVKCACGAGGIMKVREIMVKEVVILNPDDNAQEALFKLFKLKISGLPVIDREGRLAGMFTEKGILTFVLPSYIEKVGRFIYEENPKSLKEKFVKLSAMTVSQLMRKEVFTTTPGTTLSEAARLMLTLKARRLPVVDESLKVVGIVSRNDLLKALIEESGITMENK
jgi:CBS domain-containing protein